MVLLSCIVLLSWEKTNSIDFCCFYPHFFLQTQLHTRILREFRMTVIPIIPLWVLLLWIKSSFLFYDVFNFGNFLFQIFVGNLDSNVTNEHLRQTFSSYGELVHVKIPVGKQCGFVQFTTRFALFPDSSLYYIELFSSGLMWLQLLTVLLMVLQELCWGGLEGIEWGTNRWAKC